MKNINPNRKDTDRGRGGGIIVYAKKEIDIWNTEVKTQFHQCVTVKVKKGSEDVNINVIYRSPNSKKANDDDLSKWITEIRGPSLLIGDFNFPDVDWESGIAGSKGRGFFEATSEAFFDQHVSEPTHVNGNILDLILCNRDGMVSEVSNEGRIGKSDHDIVSFKLHVNKIKTADQRVSFNYAKANFEGMREEMRIDWNEKLAEKNVNEVWHCIKAHITGLIDEYIPKKKE